MALLYRATLVPSKLELVATWAPKQPWFAGDQDAALESVASFRFDDPDGEVGIETLLVRAAGGPVMQIPLTYRNEQRPGPQDGFIGNLEHSVLGTRWVYDATTDPVYLGELARAILSGGTQVEQWIELDGVMTRREPSAEVIGSGSAAALDPESVVLDVVRVPTHGHWDGLVLTGTWTGHPDPTVLATARTR
jgi:hypothetical protein